MIIDFVLKIKGATVGFREGGGWKMHPLLMEGVVL